MLQLQLNQLHLNQLGLRVPKRPAQRRRLWKPHCHGRWIREMSTIHASQTHFARFRRPRFRLWPAFAPAPVEGRQS